MDCVHHLHNATAICRHNKNCKYIYNGFDLLNNYDNNNNNIKNIQNKKKDDNILGRRPV